MSTIWFEAESVSVSGGSRSSNVSLEIEADGRIVAGALDVDDRLHDLDMRDIIDEAGAIKLLDAFTPGELSNWVSTSHSGSYVDLLNAIGLDAIHEYLSHVE